MFFSLADSLLKRPPLNSECYIDLQSIDIQDSCQVLKDGILMYKNLSTLI